ncbi:GNAT family N-acetyltransferase [Micromonospora sp. NPDC003197]
MTFTRLVSLDDAEALAAQLTANRAFLEPWEPARDDEYFIVDAQRAVLEMELELHAYGTMLPRVVVDEGDQVIGRINLNGITRGAFQSASIGYWVSGSHNGRGIASGALAEIVTIAFQKLKLHRLQAETLLHNTASQRVLTRNGFRPYGVAPSYLKIAGMWQDHILFHLINPEI